MTGDNYQILFDYGSEGMKFYDQKEFDTVDEAVKYAVGLNYATKFYIVSIFWEPSQIGKENRKLS